MSIGRLTYNPFISIVETYETSGDLKLMSELLKIPEDEFAETDTRNTIIEFGFTQWTSLRLEDTSDPNWIVSYPVTDESQNIYSNLLEMTTKEMKVFDLRHFEDNY